MKASRPSEITDEWIGSVQARLRADQRVRRALPMWGRLHLDRRLPFLVVYRRPQAPDPGTDRLVTGFASYLTAPGDRRHRPQVRRVAGAVADTLAEAFGAVLLLEIWTSDPVEDDPEPAPSFTIHAPPREARHEHVAALRASLQRITLLDRPAEVRIERDRTPHPVGFGPILTPSEPRPDVHVVGLEIRPMYQQGDAGYPLLTQALRRSLTVALQRSFFRFSRTMTTHRPRTYHALGRRAMVKAAWDADAALSRIARRYDLLLAVTPINATQAWAEFERSRYERTPTFRYRPVADDPARLKRELHAVRIERVEDPALADLFGAQQATTDRQLSLLAERNTPAFAHDSFALYGDVDASLLGLASEILERIPPSRSAGPRVEAEAFARTVEEHLARYRRNAPDLGSGAEVRDDVSSLMVSRGKLLVGDSVRVPRRRVEALLAHEIGTHVLSFHNGRKQRLTLLASGLARYESLQEGLGVLAEHLVGGLTPARLRLLAARVMAVRLLGDGADFVETFRELTRTYGLSKRGGYQVAMRVHRSGGFAKDAIYLRGLSETLAYLGSGGRIEMLLAGKFGLEHAPIVEELQRRKVLQRAAVLPLYLEDPTATARLEELRRGRGILDLLEEAMG